MLLLRYLFFAVGFLGLSWWIVAHWDVFSPSPRSRAGQLSDLRKRGCQFWKSQPLDVEQLVSGVEPEKPTYLQDDFANASGVLVPDGVFNDDVASYLRDLKLLRSVTAWGIDKGDAQEFASMLSELPQLSRLNLNLGRFPGDFFTRPVASLPLQRLSVQHSNFNDGMLKAVTTNRALRWLNCSETEVTCLGVRHLKELRELEVLGLGSIRLDHDALRVVCNLPKLQVLRISCDQRDRHFMPLQNATSLLLARHSLQFLSIAAEKLDMESARMIATMPNLKTFEFCGKAQPGAYKELGQSKSLRRVVIGSSPVDQAQAELADKILAGWKVEPAGLDVLELME